MIGRIKNLLGNHLLIKVASLNSVSVVLRIIGGLLTSKFIAIFVGASGLAVIGNLRDLITAVQSVSTLGLYNGIIKYVAELKRQGSELSKFLGTVFLLQMGSVILVATIVFTTAPYLNDYLFSGQDYVFLLRILCFAIPFYAAKMFLFAWLNGLSEFKRLLTINISAQIVAVAINCFLIWKFGLEGALLFVVTIEAVLFVIAMAVVWQSKIGFPTVGPLRLKSAIVKNLSSYAGMALLSAVLLPIASVLIRNYLIDHVGLKEAGFWVAMTRISNYYLMFVSSLIAMYVLPKLSEATTDLEFRKEVFYFYKTIFPIFIAGLLLVYLLRTFIINLIFSEEFQPVTELFKWQLLGDLLKVVSMVVSYQFLAKKMVLQYVFTEIVSIVILVASSMFLIDRFGTEGATMGHLISYLVYAIMILLIFYKPLFGKKRRVD